MIVNSPQDGAIESVILYSLALISNLVLTPCWSFKTTVIPEYIVDLTFLASVSRSHCYPSHYYPCTPPVLKSLSFFLSIAFAEGFSQYSLWSFFFLFPCPLEALVRLLRLDDLSATVKFIWPDMDVFCPSPFAFSSSWYSQDEKTSLCGCCNTLVCLL